MRSRVRTLASVWRLICHRITYKKTRTPCPVCAGKGRIVAGGTQGERGFSCRRCKEKGSVVVYIARTHPSRGRDEPDLLHEEEMRRREANM